MPYTEDDPGNAGQLHQVARLVTQYCMLKTLQWSTSDQ